MAATGKVTATKVGDDVVFTDESGASFTIRGYGVAAGLPLEIDPRIDLTKPMYEQVMKLEARDRAAQRKQQDTAA